MKKYPHDESQKSEGGKLQRSDLSVVPWSGKFSSPVEAASSGPFSADAAPERSLDYFLICGSTNMSALTGLVLRPGRPQPHYSLSEAKLAYVRLSQVKKIKKFTGLALPPTLNAHGGSRAGSTQIGLLKSWESRGAG